MKNLRCLATTIAAIGLTAAFAGAGAQELRGPPADPSQKFSTPMPPGVAAPATLETRFGKLRFEGGVQMPQARTSCWKT